MQVPESLVVDANPLISALLGGAAREILFSRQIVFFAAQHTLFEVAKLFRGWRPESVCLNPICSAPLRSFLSRHVNQEPTTHPWNEPEN